MAGVAEHDAVYRIEDFFRGFPSQLGSTAKLMHLPSHEEEIPTAPTPRVTTHNVGPYSGNDSVPMGLLPALLRLPRLWFRKFQHDKSGG